jgi:geranylgeranyl diphosphate synthase type I
VLAWAAELVTPALRTAIERLDPTNRALASYHLGWTDRAGTPCRGGGKGMRPALALLSAHAVGGPASVALPGAVAVELVHNFSLVHDDVMDGDTRRRGRDTVWAVWGVPSAVLTGDALLGLAIEVLLEVPTPPRAQAAALITATTRELIDGQTRDLEFETRARVGTEEALLMASGKTGALLGASAAIGAILAGGEEAQVHALARYGRQLGVAFQLVDDLLGIWGDPHRTGKPVYSDLRTGKKSLPVAYALNAGGPISRRLSELLADPERRVRHAEDAADLVLAAGGRDWAAAEARRRMNAALEALRAAPFDLITRAELAGLAEFVIARKV